MNEITTTTVHSQLLRPAAAQLESDIVVFVHVYYSLLGIMDQVNNTAIDLNRPLPELPTYSSPLLPKHSSKLSSPPEATEDTDNRLTGSTLSTNASVSKQQFRNIAHDFLIPSTPQHSPRTIDKLGLLDPVKYSPSEDNEKISKMPAAYVVHFLVYLSPRLHKLPY